jgi:two-component system sensor histidine kinase BaeS
MTVRRKMFVAMGTLIVLVCVAYAIATRGYLGGLFYRFQNERLDAAYLNASHAEQIAMLRAYVLHAMRSVGMEMGIFFTAIGLMFVFWLSGALTRPLRKLGVAIEQVAQGDLDVNVPVQRTVDEYCKLIGAFNDMTSRLRQAEEVRKRLVADVAHELRTPLSVMQLKLENIQQASSFVPTETLLPLHDEVIRLSRLVDDLHVLSLADAERLPLERGSVDLAQRLERIVDDIREEVAEHGLDIRLSAPTTPVVVTADARRITQVFLNLLTNAIRYTPRGGTISVEIEYRVVDRENRYAAVSVTDTGIGIPAEELPRLFDRFYRVEEARSRHTGGTGLGLSIAHQLVKAHGGFIRVVSELGEGTSFTVYLPAASGNT